MNQIKKTVILALVFVGIIAGAAVSYNYLSSKYTPSSDAVGLPVPNQGDNASETTPEETKSETIAAETTAPETSVSETSAPETEPPLTPAPDFTVTNAEGESVSLSDYVGKPVIINFWATWCGPCQSELPAFNNAYLTHGEEVHFLMVNLADSPSETVTKVTSFLDSRNYSFPVLFDTKWEGAMTYGVYSIPLTVFVDAKGNLLGGHTGAMSASTLEQYIDILLTYYAEP